MAWINPQFTRQQVNRAGKVLIDENPDPVEYDRAFEIVDNWRSAHNFPLNTFQITLRNRVRTIEPQGTVAQRIKRLSSIESKLRREKNMALSQMQDIGGCRAILSSISQVASLKDRYEKVSLQHKLVKCYDYIAKPAPSGYRGVHLVYKYTSNESRYLSFNDLRIEIQLRTRLQHAWATAVETVGTFTNQALKASQGEEEWLDFFRLMSSAIAVIEKSKQVDGTPQDRVALKDAIIQQEQILGVIQRLNAFRTAIQYIPRAGGAESFFFLLQLDVAKGQLLVETFPKEKQAAAAARYVQVERQAKETGDHDAVLVSVDSVSKLKRAYPNYFADTRAFMTTINQVMSGKF